MPKLKNQIMKKIFLITLSIFAISCKSQVVSLETAAQCSTSNPCPDYNYAKDINNSLEKYVGTWKGTYNGRQYELKFNKNLYQGFLGNKRDRIKGRLRITTIGNLPLIIFDNYSELDDEKTNFSGLGFQPNLQSYIVHFSGPLTSGCINSGDVYLTINPNTPNQMKIFYWSDKDIVVGDCPSSFTQTFPEKQTIMLTKQ